MDDTTHDDWQFSGRDNPGVGEEMERFSGVVRTVLPLQTMFCSLFGVAEGSWSVYWQYEGGVDDIPVPNP